MNLRLKTMKKVLHQEQKESQIELERKRELNRRVMDESHSTSQNQILKHKNSMLETVC